MRVELMRRRGNAWEIRGVGSFDHRYEPRNDGAKSPAERKAEGKLSWVSLGVGGDECDMCLLYLPSIRVRARGNGL